MGHMSVLINASWPQGNSYSNLYEFTREANKADVGQIGRESHLLFSLQVPSFTVTTKYIELTLGLDCSAI